MNPTLDTALPPHAQGHPHGAEHPRDGLAAARSAVRDLVHLVRPGQWPKSLLVVPLALLDAPALTGDVLARVAWAVVVFTLASSLIYVGNDIVDRQRDRVHPTKRYRPIAAGRISPAAATGFALTLALLLALAVAAAPPIPWWPVLAYLALNVAYSRWLKHVPLLDVFTVAAGFVLRAVQGYLAVSAEIATWLLISVFTLCLLLILSKRRHEIAVVGQAHRPALAGYSVQYLDHLMVLCAMLTITAFLQYLNADGFAAPYTDLVLLVSVPFATFAIARYLQAVVVDRDGGDPVRLLLRDRVILASGLAWAVVLGLSVVAAHYATPLHLYR